MSKSIFVSCVYEDKHRLDTIVKWATDGRLGNGIIVTHETEDKRALGKEAIKQHIRKKIEGAAIVFVLIGNDTHNHNWITAEVELANSFHKEIICIRIPNTTGAAPQILANKKEISFNPEPIQRLLL